MPSPGFARFGVPDERVRRMVWPDTHELSPARTADLPDRDPAVVLHPGLTTHGRKRSYAHVAVRQGRADPMRSTPSRPTIAFTQK
jgi:hypothetical protein